MYAAYSGFGNRETEGPVAASRENPMNIGGCTAALAKTFNLRRD
jgi:hypothetical protein